MEPGMDPKWSGRGGGALPALMPSCVGHVRRPPMNLPDYCKVLLDYCIWIVIVVHSSLIIMLLLKLLYLILSLIFFCFIMKNSSPPAPPLAGGGGVRTLVSELSGNRYILVSTDIYWFRYFDFHVTRSAEM
jgi:hypothetical protein